MDVLGQTEDIDLRTYLDLKIGDKGDKSEKKWYDFNIALTTWNVLFGGG